MKYVLAALLLLPSFAFAETTLALEASARSEVPNDEMVVDVGVEQKGSDVGKLNEGVLVALNAISAKAKSVEGIDARLGNVGTSPVYADSMQRGWSVHGNIELRSKDAKTLGQLTAELAKQYQIEGIRFELSQERRNLEERALLKQAALNFRHKAGEAVSAFGYSSYEIKQLAINEPGMVQPYRMEQVQTASLKLSLPEGKSEVVVNVSGSVLMK